MSEKCRNSNSDNPLTSRRTDGGKNSDMQEESPLTSERTILKCSTSLAASMKPVDLSEAVVPSRESFIAVFRDKCTHALN